MITNNVSTLKINKLTQEQYDRELLAGNIKEDELYITPSVPTAIDDAMESVSYDDHDKFLQIKYDEQSDSMFVTPTDILGSKFVVNDSTGLDFTSYGRLWFNTQVATSIINFRGLDTKIIDVVRTGAKGDGVTDDSIAIQTAMETARDIGGGIVFFPKGTYMIGSALGDYIEFYSNMHIFGAPGAVLKFHESVADIINANANDTSVSPICLLRNHTDAQTGGYDCTENVIIENIIFDCNDAFAKKATSVGIGHAKNIIFRNCHWINGKSSDLDHHHYLEINACKDVKLIDCSFTKSLTPSTGGTSEMVNIDVADDGNYGKSTYYLGDGTQCRDIEIIGCKFETYARDSFPAGHYASPAIGSHANNNAINGLKIHDCQFDGDWGTNGQERQWVIKFYGNNLNCKVYNNTFRASSSGLEAGKKPLGICVQSTSKTNFIYNNFFSGYDANTYIANNNDKEKTAIRVNNYCFNAGNSVTTDSNN